jgi:hypothetical protein
VRSSLAVTVRFVRSGDGAFLSAGDGAFLRSGDGAFFGLCRFFRSGQVSDQTRALRIGFLGQKPVTVRSYFSRPRLVGS